MLIKILKFCTGSSAKSYQCKFGINCILLSRVVVAEELGKAIQDVIHYYTLRGKFSSVHSELRREGIVRVEVGEKGLHFIHESGDDQYFKCSFIYLGLGDSREGQDSLGGLEDEDKEEKLLKQAIALSLEGLEENDVEEKDNNEQDGQDEDGEEEEEELMLRQAIALSLEGAEEEDD